MKDKDLLDIWIQGRFGYALPALKVALGNLVSMAILDSLKPGFLQKTLTFPEAITYGHVLAYLTAASGLVIAAYYAGDFWINLGSWIIKKLVKVRET